MGTGTKTVHMAEVRRRLVHVVRTSVQEAATAASQAAPILEDLVQRAFTEMDVDMDGGVTQEEFVAACLQQRVAATSLALKVIDIFVAG